MRPVFKCDYCKFMGTEEKVKEHEPKCTDNYDRRSCYTCVHKKLEPKDKQWFYKCKLGKEIPEGQIFEFCPQYEKNENNHVFTDLFGGLFDGVFK